MSCVCVQQRLQQQFGVGELRHASSEVALAPAGELHSGSCVIRARLVQVGQAATARAAVGCVAVV